MDSAPSGTPQPEPGWEELVGDQLDTLRRATLDNLRKMDSKDADTRHFVMIMINTAVEALNAEQSDIIKTDRTAFYRLQLKRFAKIADMSRRLAQIMAMNGVKGKYISRVQAAEILGVHQGTVARWVKDWDKTFEESIIVPETIGWLAHNDKIVADERIDE